MMYDRCEIFTPYEIVLELLNRVGYITNLYGKKVLENSCGDGQILNVIVERYILDCLKRGLSIEDIKQGLQRDIYGAEINKKHYLTCIENLNLTAAKYNINNISWNIFNEDILKKNLDLTFDYIVGNPPYIKYKDIDNNTRIFLKNNYEVCEHGKFDYCYAFIEFGLRYLNEKGILSYLIPSSIFKNVFAQKLRDIMLPSITNIYDYTIKNIFEKVLTSSAIFICNKGYNTKYLTYSDIVNKTSYTIEKENLENGKWMFLKNSKKIKNKRHKFNDYFNASITIATLYNKAFVIKDYIEQEDCILVKDHRIEKKIIRETASPRSLKYKKKEFIIYPYYYKENKLYRYNEEVFKSEFSEAARYLETYYDNLLKRNSDKSAKWYEYGRSQALSHMNQEKLLISTVVTKEINVYELSKVCVPYSGIYITAKEKLPLSYAKKILESKSFYEYVKKIGINASGESIRITAVDINNFEFCEEEI